MKNATPRRRHNLGYLIAIIATVSLIAILLSPESGQLITPGPMNTGHELLVCESCHKNAKGSLRQQLQANVQYFLGNKESLVDIGYRPVGNSDCLACHSRKNDRHPVFRFYEPRFKNARESVQPHLCISCHLEHKGVRVTAETDFCSSCHEDLEIKKDSLQVSHKQLVKQKKWKSCLGCHDYHGNHIMKVTNDSVNSHSDKVITEYFNGDDSPYSTKKRYKAKEIRNDE